MSCFVMPTLAWMPLISLPERVKSTLEVPPKMARPMPAIIIAAPTAMLPTSRMPLVSKPSFTVTSTTMAARAAAHLMRSLRRFALRRSMSWYAFALRWLMFLPITCPFP